jgi:Flp pilus assembly protein TadG
MQPPMKPQPIKTQRQPAYKKEHGQSMVELALILPVMLLLVFGTIDIGLGVKTYIGLTNATREGVRWISIHPSDRAGAEARVAMEAGRVGLADSAISADGYTVSFSPNKSAYNAGERVTVRIDYTYPILFGALTGLGDMPFNASSTMVVLYDE